MGQQVVREQHRLGVLQVGAARHGHPEVSICLRHQGIHDVEHQPAHQTGVFAQVHPEQGGHLVVA